MDPNTHRTLAYCEGITSNQRERDELFNKLYCGS